MAASVLLTLVCCIAPPDGGGRSRPASFWQAGRPDGFPMAIGGVALGAMVRGGPTVSYNLGRKPPLFSFAWPGLLPGTVVSPMQSLTPPQRSGLFSTHPVRCPRLAARD